MIFKSNIHSFSRVASKLHEIMIKFTGSENSSYLASFNSKVVSSYLQHPPITHVIMITHHSQSFPPTSKKALHFMLKDQKVTNSTTTNGVKHSKGDGHF